VKQIERSFDTLESDLLRLTQGHPLDRSIEPPAVAWRRHERMKLHELAVAGVLQHRRRAAVVLLPAERPQDLKRQPPVGVDVHLDGLQADRQNHAFACFL